MRGSKDKVMIANLSSFNAIFNQILIANILKWEHVTLPHFPVFYLFQETIARFKQFQWNGGTLIILMTKTHTEV